MSINELQDEVIAEFSDFDDWMDRYQLLIDLGNEQEPLEEKYKTEQNLIEGCQSRVWLQADDVDGKIVFKAESDALIVKGIIALLIKVFSGHTPDEILNADLYFIDDPRPDREEELDFTYIAEDILSIIELNQSLEHKSWVISISTGYSNSYINGNGKKVKGDVELNNAIRKARENLCLIPKNKQIPESDKNLLYRCNRLQ